MVLATIIRLEMAYPGVGILAGDSLQYLSVVTAHAVIMVFFMIMPLLFGAFGNFLLPTQLGVHDVAFPRLNSAAFWFLPGGLIMLCQLICLDRRYQRMNCFNIREMQAILKSRFFTDLVNEHDTRLFLDKTIVGLRFKTEASSVIHPNMLLFYRLGVYNTSAARRFNLTATEPENGYVLFNGQSFILKAIRSYGNVRDSIFSRFVFANFRGLMSIFCWGNYDLAINVKGRATFDVSTEGTANLTRSEIDRCVHGWVSTLNFDEPFWVSYR